MAQDPINDKAVQIDPINVNNFDSPQGVGGGTTPGAEFSPTEYELLKSEENLAPNFQVDRGLGQSSSNVDYNAPVPQPNFSPIVLGDQVPGSRAVTGPSEQIGPDFTPIRGEVGGESAITEGAPIGPDFSNPKGTGEGSTGGGFNDFFTGGGWNPTGRTRAANPSAMIPKTEDWRFRIGLMPGSDVFYKDGNRDSILAPLIKTDGVVFPYTPNVLVNYRANYDSLSPTHSNYANHFYQHSIVQDVQVNATFTAQSTEEADYMMAAIHFFKSATKMFYGQDQNKGTPPPVLGVSGFGPDQFNFHKAVINQFNYSLPEDVDYIRTSKEGPAGIEAQQTRARLNGGSGDYGLFGTVGRIGRLFGIGADVGAERDFQAANEGTNLAKAGSSYVPTKIEISLILLPVVTRAEQSRQFSLKDYASGKGLSQRGQW